MYLENESDQKRAFDLDHQYSKYGNNGAKYYCLWEARRDAARRGFAPDNVKDTIWDTYDAKNERRHSYLDSHNRWVEDERYDAPFQLRPQVTYGDEEPKYSTQNKDWCDIFIAWDPDDERYKKNYEGAYEKVKAYLQKQQDKQNAITEHRVGTTTVHETHEMPKKNNGVAGGIAFIAFWTVVAVGWFVMAALVPEAAGVMIFVGIICLWPWILLAVTALY